MKEHQAHRLDRIEGGEARQAHLEVNPERRKARLSTFERSRAPTQRQRPEKASKK
jgi:hypothetical protein